MVYFVNVFAVRKDQIRRNFMLTTLNNFDRLLGLFEGFFNTRKIAKVLNGLLLFFGLLKGNANCFSTFDGLYR